MLLEWAGLVPWSLDEALNLSRTMELAPMELWISSEQDVNRWLIRSRFIRRAPDLGAIELRSSLAVTMFPTRKRTSRLIMWPRWR